MRSLSSLVLPVLVSLSVAGCDSNPAGPSGVAIGQEFTLAPGESAIAGDSGLRVEFERVVEDSRCPSDAVCITAGRVVLEVAAGRGSSRPLYRLEPGQSLTANRLRVRLLAVQPYPSSQSPIAPAQYRATFVVERE